jgi:hypothetical protein
MKRNRERELQPVNIQRLSHAAPRRETPQQSVGTASALLKERAQQKLWNHSRISATPCVSFRILAVDQFPVIRLTRIWQTNLKHWRPRFVFLVWGPSQRDFDAAKCRTI